MPLDLTEPCLVFGAGAAGQQVAFDLVEPGKHFWVYGEHGASQACVRCSLLRPDPVQRQRLVEIRDNLEARIIEAKREGWLGEVEGLQVSLTGANDKIAQIDATVQRTTAATDLGMPTFSSLTGRTTSSPG
jgi:hypothetical protein